MTLTDERRKRLTEYLGLCWHEGRMPINCGYRCVKCGDTYVVNRTFDNDADMMALFRKIKDSKKFSSFWHFANEKIFELKKYGCHLHELEYNKCKITDMPCSLNWCPIIYWVVDKDRDAVELDWLFYDPERFCNLVAEWLEVKK